MRKFKIFNQFRDAVIIVNNQGKIVYRNSTFKRWFKDFTDLTKFSHNMNFDVCPLNSENIENYSPIWHALTSPENFFANVSYQNNQNKIFYYDMTVIKKDRIILVLIFIKGTVVVPIYLISLKLFLSLIYKYNSCNGKYKLVSISSPFFLHKTTSISDHGKQSPVACEPYNLTS